MREILKGYGGGWRATFGRENTASLSRKFERRVLNHVWWCCSAGSINGWEKRLFWPEIGWFGCANCGCGYWVSGGIDSDWYGLIASELGSYRVVVCQAGSMLAVPPSSRASPLPHLAGGVFGICVWRRMVVIGMASSRAGSLPHLIRGVHRRSPVGVSLLAMAVCQATSILTVPPSSRASSLPQGLQQA